MIEGGPADSARRSVDVSIVIPARNRREYLVESLGLLAVQSFPADRFEVIVVDDGSSDGTGGALEGRSFPFALRYERLEREDESFWAARPRNVGLKAAGGEVTILLDSDVFVGSSFVAAHWAVHAGRSAALPPRVGVGHIYGAAVDNDDRTARKLAPPSIPDLANFILREQRPPARWREGRAEYGTAWPQLARCPIGWLFFWTGNVSFPTEVVRRLGGFDEQFRGWGGEDTDLGYRLFTGGAEFQWVPDAWGVHYPHPVRPEIDGEARRSCLHLLRKFPDPLVEAALWSIRFAGPDDHPPDMSVGAWRAQVVTEIEEARRRTREAAVPPALPPAVLEQIGAWRERGGGRPIFWCGPLPPDHGLEPGSIICSDPFGDGSGPDGRLRLLGLTTPWVDDTFSVAVAAHYWAALGPGLLRAVVRELERLAPTVIFLARDGQAVEATTSLLGRAPSRVACADQRGPLLVWTAAG
jgi:GT2 family glycosyltransferase